MSMPVITRRRASKLRIGAADYHPRLMTRARPTVAMVGAGQLARMGWQAAISLDLGLICLGAPDDAAILAGAELLEGSARDPDALVALAARGDVLTFEHELVDLDTVRRLEADGVAVRPGSTVLALAVDKLHQRRTLSETYGLAVPAFAPAPDLAAVQDFAAAHGLPLVGNGRAELEALVREGGRTGEDAF